MLTFYIVAAIVGGLLVLVSVFSGAHSDHGHEFGGDHHFEAGHGADGHDHGAHDGDGPWIPFFSVRFWTYFAMTFGLCGILLQLIVKTPEPTAAILSGTTGLIVGLLVAYGMRVLSRTDLDSSISPKDLLGKEAQVLVAIRPGQLGRIRVASRGEVLDLLASSDDPNAMEAGSFAVIVDLDGDRVKVVSRESVFGNPQSLNA